MDQNDPDYQEYQQYLEYQKHLASTSESRPYESPGVAPENGAVSNTIDRIKDPEQWKRLGHSMLSGDKSSPVVEGTAPVAAPVGSLGAVGRLATYLAGSAPRRIGVNTAIGAVRGAMKEPAEGETRLGNAGSEAALSGGLAAGGEAIGSGSSKVADWLMQKASGMKKYIPGVGTRLVDQGLAGTKSMMANQVDEALPEAEKKVQGIVKGIPENIEPHSLKDAIMRQGDRFKLSTGEVPSNVKPYMDKVRHTAESFSDLTGGKMSAEDLLRIKRQGDWLGYSASGNPATSLEADMGRAQADEARNLLSGLSGGASKEALADEQALLLAKKGLNKPESIHSGIGSQAIFGKVPGESLFGSVGAQALQKGVSPAAKTAANPLALQGLLQMLEKPQSQ